MYAWDHSRSRCAGPGVHPGLHGACPCDREAEAEEPSTPLKGDVWVPFRLCR